VLGDVRMADGENIKIQYLYIMYRMDILYKTILCETTFFFINFFEKSLPTAIIDNIYYNGERAKIITIYTILLLVIYYNIDGDGDGRW